MARLSRSMFIFQEVTRITSFQLQFQRMAVLIMRRYFHQELFVAQSNVIVSTRVAVICSIVSLTVVSVLQLFTTAADILWKIGEDGMIIQDFVQLGVKAKTAAFEAMDAEAVLGDIPDEFLDPIQVIIVFAVS